MNNRSEGIVELDIFSGRPNPSWHLTPLESGELSRRLRDLQEIHPPRNPPGLGYRGFVLHVAAEGGPQDFRVGDGVIETGGKYFLDHDRELEKLLIRMMPADLRSQYSGVFPGLGQ